MGILFFGHLLLILMQKNENLAKKLILQSPLESYRDG